MKLNEKLNVLIKLTKEKRMSEIKTFLMDQDKKMDQNEKGRLFILYLEELYKGNGYLTKVNKETNDLGIDLFLYHPDNPTEIEWGIQGKNQVRPLNYDNINIELHKYTYKASKVYNCRNYRLISVSGFVDTTEIKNEKLLKEYMSLSSWNYIEELIHQYDPVKNFKPSYELSPFNESIHQNVLELIETNGSAAIIQPTGTGKSGIIYKSLMTSYLNEEKLILAPSLAILNQYKEEYGWSLPKTRYMTYSKLLKLTVDDIKQLNLSVLVLDEYHRLGGDKWGEKTKELINFFPNVKIIGATATPIRYLDGNRNMTDEFFGNNIASNINLGTATAKQMLRFPIYVSALYSLNQEYSNLLKEIEKSQNKLEEKEVFTRDLNKLKIDWESCKGISNILDKYIRPTDNKFIVFCHSEEHLRDMRIEVEKWFRKTESLKHKDVQKYTVMSNYSKKKNAQALNDFRNADDQRKIHLLFAINMLNEGIHIKDVSGVILLRTTESPNIYLQQIGRTMDAHKSTSPIIFDLVNNFNNIKSKDILNELVEAEALENEKRRQLGLPQINVLKNVQIIDETKDLHTDFQSIENALIGTWDKRFNELLSFKEEFGHSLIPADDKNQQLARWVITQRQFYKNNQLSEQRIKQLESIDFVWDPLENRWNQLFSQLLIYKEEYGNCDVPGSFENKTLSNWVAEQRMRYKNGTIPEPQIKQLESIDFSWSIASDDWHLLYNALVKYKEENGNCDVPFSYENQRLAKWVSRQREMYKKGKLNENKIQLLENIDFVWDPFQEKRNNLFHQLIKYKEKFGNCDVPQRYENKPLARWVQTLRQQYKKNQLPSEFIDQLSHIGFDFDPLETKWKEMYSELVKYQTEFGNCFVPRHSEYKSLGQWVVNQRKAYHSDTLSEERIKLLKDIGFVWDSLDTKWYEMFRQLVSFKKEYGHFNVSRKSAYSRLSSWIGAQRKAHKNGEISKSRKDELESIGFEW